MSIGPVSVTLDLASPHLRNLHAELMHSLPLLTCSPDEKGFVHVIEHLSGKGMSVLLKRRSSVPVEDVWITDYDKDEDAHIYLAAFTEKDCAEDIVKAIKSVFDAPQLT